MNADDDLEKLKSVLMPDKRVIVQDFGTDELKAFLAEGLGFALSSLERLPGYAWSLNFRAVRASDGLTFLVKCAPADRGGLHRKRWEALVAHVDDLAGAGKATQRLFADGPASFRQYKLLFLSWCPGERRMPDRLSPDDFAEFLADYSEFSKAMQSVRLVESPDFLKGLRWGTLTALDRRGVRWLRRLIEREIPLASVTYDPDRLRVIHGDLHHGNFHFIDGRVTGFFDLEEFRYGYPAQDIVRYLVCAIEHVRWYAAARRSAIVRQFVRAVERMPYAADEWRLALCAYFLWKSYGRVRNGRIGFLKALNLRFRFGLYARLLRLADERAPSSLALHERFERLRGEPIVRYAHAPEDVPCRETSDPARLCRKPLVSVVMTAYNHERYIAEAIESVLAQKASFEYELLLCEDCSKDRTREICFDYQRRAPDRVRVLWSDQNVFGALGGNEPRGEAHCRGDYIAYCEGDDYWRDPLKLQKQIDSLSAHPTAGLCFGGTDFLYQGSGRTIPFDPARAAPGEFLKGWDFVDRFLLGKDEIDGQTIHTSATVVRQDALAAARRRFPDIFSWHLRMRDWTRILSVASVSDVCFVGEPLSVYRRENGTGLTQRDTAKLVMDDAICRIYFAMKALNVSLADALSVFGRRLALQKLRLAAQADGTGQRAVWNSVESVPELKAYFRNPVLRLAGGWLRRGTFGKVKFKFLRGLFLASVRMKTARAARRLRRRLAADGPVAILEVSHKPYAQVRMSGVVPVQGGRAVMREKTKDGRLSSEDVAWMTSHTVGDDTGDNVSAMNRRLNEFTVLYWAWKNPAALGNPAYVGLMHYRRHFVVDFDPAGETYAEVLGLTPAAIRSCVERYGTCCRFPRRRGHGSIIDQLKRDMLGYHAYPAFEKACEIIRRRSEADYRWVMEIARGEEMGGLCSMFLMKRADFESYCAWLLPVLKELEAVIPSSPDPQEQRVIGWCGEVLTSIWLYRHAQSHPIHYLHVFSHESVENLISRFRHLRRRLLMVLGVRFPADDDKMLAYEICRRFRQLKIRNEMMGSGVR